MKPWEDEQITPTTLDVRWANQVTVEQIFNYLERKEARLKALRKRNHGQDTTESLHISQSLHTQIVSTNALTLALTAILSEMQNWEEH